jgi:hypothetical protein
MSILASGGRDAREAAVRFGDDVTRAEPEMWLRGRRVG